MKNLLVYAGMGLKLSSVALWPTVLIHAAMAVWCVMRLLGKQARVLRDGGATYGDAVASTQF